MVNKTLGESKMKLDNTLICSKEIIINSLQVLPMNKPSIWYQDENENILKLYSHQLINCCIFDFTQIPRHDISLFFVNKQFSSHGWFPSPAYFERSKIDIWDVYASIKIYKTVFVWL